MLPDNQSSDNQSIDHHSNTVVYRRGTAEDLIATHRLFLDSVYDLIWRIGIQAGDRAPSASERRDSLARWQPIFEFLTATADQYWLAERDGELLGYARSILRDDTRELTDFFVAPAAQSLGVGRELIRRAMPPGSKRTYILATLDLRAQALYHKLGVYQICAVYTFHKDRADFVPLATPAQASTATDESSAANEGAPLIVPMTLEHLPLLARLDETIHGHRRDEDHTWLMTQRTGFVLLHNDKAVGYGYVGEPYSGPFVMLNTADYPLALGYAENLALEQGQASFGIDVPMLNRTAIAYLLAHGYRMSPFFCFYMCDVPPPHVDKTIITAPMIII